MAEVLSQSQIDALLNAARSGEMDLAASAEKTTEKKYRKYDFYSPRKFTKDRMKMISGIFENYTRVITPGSMDCCIPPAKFLWSRWRSSAITSFPTH